MSHAHTHPTTARRFVWSLVLTGLILVAEIAGGRAQPYNNDAVRAVNRQDGWLQLQKCLWNKPLISVELRGLRAGRRCAARSMKG